MDASRRPHRNASRFSRRLPDRMVDRGQREMADAQVFAVGMGFDAMRLCLGLPTKSHDAVEVMRWIVAMQTRNQ